MKKRVSLASVSSIGIAALVVLHAAVGLQGQTKPAASGTGSAGALLVDTDDSCRLVLDGKDLGVVNPDEARKISVSLGDHILKCTVEGIPDLVWRKEIEVKNLNQVAALISLKALHIQYEEATSKLQKEASNQKVPAGIPEKTTSSGAISLVGAWTVKNANGSGTYVFSADGSMTVTGRRNTGASFDLKGRWSQDGGSLVLAYQGSKEASPPLSIRSIDATHVQLIFPGHEDETQELERVSNNQSVPRPQATGATLTETMLFIQQKLNEQGAVKWQESGPGDEGYPDWQSENTYMVSDFSADAATCSFTLSKTVTEMLDSGPEWYETTFTGTYSFKDIRNIKVEAGGKGIGYFAASDSSSVTPMIFAISIQAERPVFKEHFVRHCPKRSPKTCPTVRDDTKVETKFVFREWEMANRGCRGRAARNRTVRCWEEA